MQTVEPGHARDNCVDGTTRVCDVFSLSKALMWKPRASVVRRQGRSSSWMLPVHTLSGGCVKGEDFIGELLKSLHWTRKEEHK